MHGTLRRYEAGDRVQTTAADDFRILRGVVLRRINDSVEIAFEDGRTALVGTWSTRLRFADGPSFAESTPGR